MSANPLKIVDISANEKDAAKEVLDAATSQGFLFVEGHNFTEEEVSAIFKLSREFFQLPQSYKDKYRIDESNHGYTSEGGENLDPESLKVGDPKEALNMGFWNFKSGESEKPIPDWLTSDEERNKLFRLAAMKLYDLSVVILRLLAVALEIEDTEVSGKEWFDSRYDPVKQSGSILRFLHYPCPKSASPEQKIRAGAHTDYGSVTLLFQQEGQEGLEIYSPVSKKWEAVPYVPAKKTGAAPPIVVNIGDQLSYWTSGLLKSTIHRVRFPETKQDTDRYSIVFFSHPNDETLLEPVPSPVIRSIGNRGANANKEVLTAHQHLMKRLAATYGWKN